MNKYLSNNKPTNQTNVVDAIAIDPLLRDDFDMTEHVLRDPAELNDWWETPYIITESWEDRLESHASHLLRSENNTLFEVKETKEEYDSRKEEEKAEWLNMYPSGIRYTVRSLDGGAFDRSTWKGDFPTLKEAITVAKTIQGSPMKNQTIEKSTISMEQLSNKYSDAMDENNVKKDVLTQKLRSAAVKMKDTVIKIELGDDSKIEEAIIISFFASLFNDVITAYDHYKKYYLELQSEKLKKNQETLKNKLDSIQNFKDHVEKINKYTALKIEKHYLQNKKSALIETEMRNKKEGIVQITDNPDELLKLERRFEIVQNEINTIAELYESRSEYDFMKDIEKVEEQWFGGEGANYLKCIRELDSNRVDELLENMKNLSGGSVRVNGLKNAFQKIEEHYESGGIYDEKAQSLVSEFMKRTTDVQGSITIAQLAKEGEAIIASRDSRSTFQTQI